MRFFEDIEIGSKEDLGDYLFEAEDIKAYARQFDPQPFHMDERAAEASHFGRLCASGWHTAAVWMKLMIAHRRKLAAATQDDAGPRAPLGPSPGFDDMKWLKPVYAGDTIRYSSTVAAKRKLNSRPGWGLVSAHNEGVNQHGEVVFSFTSHVLVGMRGD